MRKLLPREILAYFGAHNISNAHESPRFSVSPQEVKIHDDWNPETQRYDADIAILTFEEEIHSTAFIKSICLLTTTEQLSITEGITSGWGVSKHITERFSPIPKELKVPIHDQLDCFYNDNKLSMISSERTFCAGSGDGTGVCYGDSGSGLFIKQGNNVYLKGIVSASQQVQVDQQFLCNVNTSAIFTNVPDYKDWIGSFVGEEIIKKSDNPAFETRIKIKPETTGSVERSTPKMDLLNIFSHFIENHANCSKYKGRAPCYWQDSATRDEGAAGCSGVSDKWEYKHELHGLCYCYECK